MTHKKIKKLLYAVQNCKRYSNYDLSSGCYISAPSIHSRTYCRFYINKNNEVDCKIYSLWGNKYKYTYKTQTRKTRDGWEAINHRGEVVATILNKDYDRLYKSAIIALQYYTPTEKEAKLGYWLGL